MRPEPTRRLPRAARTLWAVEALVGWGGAAIGVTLALNALGDTVPGWADGLGA